MSKESKRERSYSLSTKWLLAVLAILIPLTMIAAKVAAGTTSSVGIGDQAPDFTLNSQDGTPVSLKDFLGKKSVVLYFYPKDNTGGCTKEACSFRDSFTAFTDAGAEVFGVSSDSEKSHVGFAEKQHLPFKLLSDPGAKVRKLYGVPSTIGLIPGRVTFVIDKGGIVRLVFNSQLDAEKHVTEALKVIKDLQAQNSSPGTTESTDSKEKS
jgi:peroxiredoxin Q/BCP